jgi:hypothetical protein
MRARPSHLLELKNWVESQYGIDGWWTCYQFDSAVTWVGRFIEGKLAEYDKTSKKQKYSLEQLLEEPKPLTVQQFAEQFKGVHGAVQVIRKKQGA